MTFPKVAPSGFISQVTASQVNQIDIDLANAVDGYGESPTYSPTSKIVLSQATVRLDGIDLGLQSSRRTVVNGESGAAFEHSSTAGSLNVETSITGNHYYHSGNDSGHARNDYWHSMSVTSGSAWADTRYYGYLFDTTQTGTLHIRLLTDAEQPAGVGNMLHGQSFRGPRGGQIVRFTKKANLANDTHFYSGTSAICTIRATVSCAWLEAVYDGDEDEWVPIAWAVGVSVYV